MNAIVAAQGEKLKLADIRRTLQMVEEAMGQSDLLPLFETTLAVRRSRRRQAKK